jgi:hypothetical protein
MKRLTARLFLTAAFAAFALAVAAPAAAANGGRAPLPEPAAIRSEESSHADTGVDVVPMAAWTFVTVVGTAIIGGVMYLFRRRIGAFPKNPSWAAPISIMRSQDLPDEGTFGDVTPGAHH